MLPEASPTAHADSPEVRRYNRIHRWIEFAGIAISFAVLLILLLTGWTRELRDFAIKLAPESYYLQLFIYLASFLLISQALAFPLEHYSFRLEHEYHLSNQRLPSWLWDQVKGLLLALVLGTIVAFIVYGTIRTSAELWWFYAWLAFIILFIFLAQIAPVVLLPLFYRFVPLADEELKARLVRLGERAGAKVRGVYEWKLSEKSKKANAALTGLGGTRRIILSDTLLGNYSHDEIEAVLAHELGHHVHAHIPKSIFLQAAGSLAAFWAANQALVYVTERLGWFSNLSDFANLPVLILVSTVLSLLLMPLLNAYSRFNERQADRYSWKSISSVEPYITAMNKLAGQNMAEREPSRWVEALLHSHPSISRRVAAARQFETLRKA